MVIKIFMVLLVALAVYRYLYQNEFGTEYRKEILQIIDKYINESEGNNGN